MTPQIRSYLVGAIGGFGFALTIASSLVAAWSRVSPATQKQWPRVGHLMVVVASLLPVAQGVLRALSGMLTGAPVFLAPPEVLRPAMGPIVQPSTAPTGAQ